uniref:Ig-like domain-containing protein n=1 Tax=Paramormyrops kingsleyae TaxID=1676925 RepID=A0A3B3S732_9TELE
MKTCFICANILYDVFATHAGREVKVVFGRVGGEVKLKPTVDQPITSITWKNGLNKAAEWGKNVEAGYYTICNPGPRCQLNTATGELTIMHLKLNEKLYFSAEINGMAAQSFFTVIALEPVSKPSVRKTCKNTQCTLVCEGKDTTYTKYSWKENNEMIADDTTTLYVQKSDKLDKIYTCVFSNPVSTEDSDPVKELDLFPGGSSGGLIAGFVSLIFAAAVCCVIGL